MNRHKGFTLIEVMIALAVAALALAAIAVTISSYATALTNLRDKTWAHWAGMNVLLEKQLEQSWPTTGDDLGDDDSTLLEVDWKTIVNDTPYEPVRKIKLQVFIPGDQSPVSSLTLYSGAHSKW